MADIDSALAGARVAVNELIAAGEIARDRWSTPRAPGKWSPSQIIEHVAMSLEESANMVAGRPTRFPNFPRFLRVIAKIAFFNRVLKKRAFPKARTAPALNPVRGQNTPQEGRVRLESAFASFDRECRAAASRGDKVTSSLFGSISVVDYAEFQELHVRHHRKQMLPP